MSNIFAASLVLTFYLSSDAWQQVSFRGSKGQTALVSSPEWIKSKQPAGFKHVWLLQRGERQGAGPPGDQLSSIDRRQAAVMKKLGGGLKILGGLAAAGAAGVILSSNHHQPAQPPDAKYAAIPSSLLVSF